MQFSIAADPDVNFVLLAISNKKFNLTTVTKIHPPKDSPVSFCGREFCSKDLPLPSHKYLCNGYIVSSHIHSCESPEGVLITDMLIAKQDGIQEEAIQKKMERYGLRCFLQFLCVECCIW